MKQSKIGRLICELTTQEVKIIRGSLLSPLLDAKEHHVSIFDYLLDHKRRLSTIQRQDINHSIFGSKISDVQLRLYLSELYRLITQCLVMLEVKDDTFYQEIKLINRFRKYDDQKLYNSQLVRSKKRIEDYPYRNTEFYDFKYEIGFLEYNQISSKSRTQDLNIQELLDDIDHIFVSKKLRQACLAVAHQSVYGLKYDYGMLTKIVEYIEDNKLQTLPPIQLYYSGFLMLSNPKEASYFNDFKEKIDGLKHLFPSEELQTIYILAINQCIRLINRGKIEYGAIALDLYQEALDEKYIYVDGHITRFTYRNIAAIAVKIGEYDWAETFTHTFKDAVKFEERESAFHFNNAIIAYHKKDFDTSLHSLQKVDFKDHLFNLAAKTIQMKVYFESHELDLLESHLDAMQMYLLRKKVIGYHKTNYHNIIKMMRKLLKLNTMDKSMVKDLKKDILSIEILSERKWLLSQLSH